VNANHITVLFEKRSSRWRYQYYRAENLLVEHVVA